MRKPKDWGQPCPNPACTHYRRLQQGNVSAIATSLTQSGKRRITYQRTPMRMISLGKCAPLKLIAIVLLPHESSLAMEGDHTANGRK